MKIIKNQTGFTLIELLIALVIFAVGILGVATMQTTSIKGNSKSRQISEASNVAADRIERMLSLDYSNPAFNDTDGNGTSQDADSNGVDDDGGNFGLDDGLAASDGQDDSDADGVDDIYWNIAVDYPVPNTKTIKVFVIPPSSAKTVEMTYIKADTI